MTGKRTEIREPTSPLSFNSDETLRNVTFVSIISRIPGTAAQNFNSFVAHRTPEST